MPRRPVWKRARDMRTAKSRLNDAKNFHRFDLPNQELVLVEERYGLKSQMASWVRICLLILLDAIYLEEGVAQQALTHFDQNQPDPEPVIKVLEKFLGMMEAGSDDRHKLQLALEIMKKHRGHLVKTKQIGR